MKTIGRQGFGLLAVAMVGLAWIADAGAAGAASSPGSAAEAKDSINPERGWRQQLAAQRREIEAASAAREQQCAKQFIVTSCVEASRATRREALTALSSREAALDDAERKQRAFEREERIKAKVAARQAGASAPPQPPLEFVPSDAASRARPLRQQVLPSESRDAGPKRPPARPDPAEIKAREAEARERFDARARDAKQRQEAAEQRERDRERAGKAPAAPLPPASISPPKAASATR